MPGSGNTWEERPRELSCAHRVVCWVCSWRVSFWLGLGGEAGLPLCRIAGLDWHCYFLL